MLLHGKAMTVSQLKMAVRSGTRASATLGEFVSAVIEPSTRSAQTKNAYRTLANEAEKYDKGITIGAITHDWIERWRASMRNDGLSENTVKGRLKALHCLTQEAIKRDLITDDPFKWITIGNMTAHVAWLSMNEIKRIEKVQLKGKIDKVRDLWLLGFYSGLRWSDLSTLEEAEIKNGILRKTMHKTNREVTIPIKTIFWGKGMEIIAKYPKIKELSHCVSCNSTANRLIKEAAKKAGIKKPISFHVARKSTASNLALLGMSTEEIATILGHSKIEVTTKHYLFSKELSLIKSSSKLFKHIPK
jgi:site-specific recombinase XerD